MTEQNRLRVFAPAVVIVALFALLFGGSSRFIEPSEFALDADSEIAADAAPARAKVQRAADEVLGLSISVPPAIPTPEPARTWLRSPDGVVERPSLASVDGAITVSGHRDGLAIAMRAAAAVQNKQVALSPVTPPPATPSPVTPPPATVTPVALPPVESTLAPVVVAPAVPTLATAVPTPVPTPVPVPTLIPPPPPAPAAPAPAPVVVAPVPPTPAAVSSGPVTIQSRGEQALASIGTNLASIGFTISFHPYTGGLRGLTYPSRNHIEIFVRPSTSDSELRYMIAHEVGHAVDLQLNSGTDHNRWRQARGMAATVGWWPNGIVNDFATPAGDFAECFASWKVGSPSHSAWGGCSSMFDLMAELAAG